MGIVATGSNLYYVVVRLHERPLTAMIKTILLLLQQFNGCGICLALHKQDAKTFEANPRNITGPRAKPAGCLVDSFVIQ